MATLESLALAMADLLSKTQQREDDMAQLVADTNATLRATRDAAEHQATQAEEALDEARQANAALLAAAKAPATPRARVHSMKLIPFTETSSEEWRGWRNHFEHCAAVNEWVSGLNLPSDLIGRRNLLGSMQKDAAFRTRHIKVDAVPTLNEMLDQLHSVFMHTVDSHTCRELFDQAVQKPDETVGDWHTRCRILFADSYPTRDTNCDDELHRTFVRGLRNGDLRDRLAGMETLDKADYAQHLTSVNRQIQAIRLKSGPAVPRAGVHALQPQHLAYQAHQQSQNSRETRACHDCGEVGHLARYCRAGKPAGRGASGQRGRNRGGRHSNQDRRAVNAMHDAMQHDPDFPADSEAQAGNY